MMKIISVRKRIILIIAAAVLIIALFLLVFTIIANQNMASGSFEVVVPVRYARDNVFKVKELPGYTFRVNCEKLTVTDPQGKNVASVPAVLGNLFFEDVNGDGLPEILSTTSVGSGIVWGGVRVYDIANKKQYLSGSWQHTHATYLKVNGRSVVVLEDYNNKEHRVSRFQLEQWTDEQKEVLDTIGAVREGGYVKLVSSFDNEYSFELEYKSGNKKQTCTAKLALDERSGEFVLCSYLGDILGGTFTVNNEEYRLQADNGKRFVFRKNGENLIFANEGSDEFVMKELSLTDKTNVLLQDGAEFSPVPKNGSNSEEILKSEIHIEIFDKETQTHETVVLPEGMGFLPFEQIFPDEDDEVLKSIVGITVMDRKTNQQTTFEVPDGVHLVLIGADGEKQPRV